MIDINIEAVSGNDVSQLQEISRQTFSETFSSSNSKENKHIFKLGDDEQTDIMMKLQLKK